MGDRGGDIPLGGIAVVWQEESGWKVERMENYSPSVASFLLTSVARRWYIVGEYVRTSNVTMLN